METQAFDRSYATPDFRNSRSTKALGIFAADSLQKGSERRSRGLVLSFRGTLRNIFIHNLRAHTQRLARAVSRTSGIPLVLALTLSFALASLVSTPVLHAQLRIDAGADIEICEGFGTKIISKYSGGTAPYFFAWSPRQGLNDTTSPTPIVNPSQGFMQYIVTLTDSKGEKARDTIVVRMNSRVYASAGDDKDVCVGSTVTLGGLPTATGGTAPFTYQWMFVPQNLSSNSSSNPFYTAERPGYMSHILHLTDSKGCESWDTVRVTISQPIRIAMTKGIEICAGMPQQIGATGIVSGGSGPYTYNWTPAVGLSDTQVPNPMAFGNETTVYRLSVTDVNGCTNADSLVVSVKPRMIATLKKHFLVCPGATIKLADANFISGGTAPLQYKWNAPSGYTLSDESNPEQSVTTLDSSMGVFEVVVRDAKGCVIRESIVVEVTSSRSALFGVEPHVCLGQDINYAFTGDLTFQYTWNITGGEVKNGQGSSNVVVLWTRAGIGSIDLTVYDPATHCQWKSKAKTIVHPLPTPKINLIGNSVLCPGSTTVLELEEDYLMKSWSSGQSTRRIIVASSGTFTVVVTDSNGCAKRSDPITISMVPAPTPLVTNPAKICDGSLATFQVTGVFNTYLWNTGETTPTIKVGDTNTRWVTVMDKSGCSGTSKPVSTSLYNDHLAVGGDFNFAYKSRETYKQYEPAIITFTNDRTEEQILDSLFLNCTNPDLKIINVNVAGRDIATKRVKGLRLSPNEKVSVTLSFNPLVADSSSYELTVRVSQPCLRDKSANGQIRSYDKSLLATAAAGNVEGAPGEDRAIPISIRFMNDQDSVENATLDFNVLINGFMFQPSTDAQRGIVRREFSKNGWHTLHLHFENLTIKHKDTVKLISIRGLMLANAKLFDSVYIDRSSIVWSPGSASDTLFKSPTTNIINGTLSLGTYCFPRTVVLRPEDKTRIEIPSNPVRDLAAVVVHAQVAGDYRFEIYSSDARKISTQVFRLPTGTSQLPLDVSQIAGGLYALIVSTPTHVQMLNLVIEK